MTADLLGYKINYEISGSGANILVLHGWGCDITLLKPLTDALSTCYRVIAADMPAHGHSPEPNAPMNVYDYADIVYALLKHENIEKTNIVAHSFGCRLSIILAAKHPELIDKMILCGAAGIKPKRGIKYYSKVYSYKAAKAIIKTFMPTKLEEWQKHKGSDDYKTLSPVMKQTFSNVVNEDLSPLLCKIKAPTFLIWGSRDNQTPLYMAQKMEKLIPDCAKVIYPDATHFAFLEQTGRTVSIAKAFFK